MVPNFCRPDLTIIGGGGEGKGWYCNCEWTLGNMMLNNIFINVDT